LDAHVFRRPAFASRDEVGGTQRGSWTHLFLEHINLSRACDADDLATQFDEIAARLRLPADAREHVDLEAIAWFMDQPEGRALRAAAAVVRREMPFVMAVPPTIHNAAARPADPNDITITRGMIDCLYDDGAGLVLIDWKTDRVKGDALKERTALYRGQVDIYARAASLMLDRPIKRRELVFLHAREVVAWT
jgi:ATP-dependent helicase/nuclease subunit A